MYAESYAIIRCLHRYDHCDFYQGRSQIWKNQAKNRGNQEKRDEDGKHWKACPCRRVRLAFTPLICITFASTVKGKQPNDTSPCSSLLSFPVCRSFVLHAVYPFSVTVMSKISSFFKNHFKSAVLALFRVKM